MLQKVNAISPDVKWPLRAGDKINGRTLVRNSLRLSNSKAIFYEKSEFISFPVPVKKKEAQRLLPLCLPYCGELGAMMFFAYHSNSLFGRSFHEVGLFLGTYSIVGKAYAFLWAAVDCEYTQFLGREFLGIAKKKYSFDLTPSPSGSGIVKRREDLMKFEWQEYGRQSPAQKVLGQKVLTVGGLVSSFLWQPIWHYHTPEDVFEHQPISINVDMSQCESGLKPLLKDEQFEAKGQWSRSNIRNSPFVIPVGITGPTWAARTYELRYL